MKKSQSKPRRKEDLAVESKTVVPEDVVRMSSWQALATVFVTGASVMIVEIVGTRVLSPVFGVGLFVWSSLLSVTMAALAAGYFLGGRMADRRPRAGVLFGTVALAGALIGLCPLLQQSVLAFCDPFGVRFGSLLSALTLFGLPLAALGAVGPMAVRLLNREVAFTGRAAGRVYGVSTVGSLVGSLATGFVLVPEFEIRYIFACTSFAIIVLGAFGLATIFRAGSLGLLLIPVVTLVGSTKSWPPQGYSIPVRTDSLYGRLEVVDDLIQGVRYLRADQSVIGCQRRDDGKPVFPYLQVLQDGLQSARPNGKDLLQIGLGIGSLPMLLAQQGIRSDAVELDPEVVRLAKEYFGFKATGDTTIEDARTYLRNADRKYDFVVHDTFTGGATPHHLLSREVLLLIRELLRPGGVLAMNVYGFHTGPNAEASRMIARTLHAVFPHVRCFRDRPLAKNSDRPANLLFFASSEPLDFPNVAKSNSEPMNFTWRRWEILQESGIGPIVSDEWNPLERLQMPVTQEYFKAMRRLFPSALWYQ